jgi:hypothetical protein
MDLQRKRFNMSNDGVEGLKEWVNTMEISPEAKSLARQYTDDLQEFVHASPSSPENRLLISQARLMLGLWERPVSVSMLQMEKMLKNHELSCPRGIFPKDVSLDRRQLALTALRVMGPSGAWIVGILTMAPAITELIQKLTERL